MEKNKFSKKVTQDPGQPAAQAMLHAIGLSREDLLKAQVGIVSTGWEGNPCNMHLNDLAVAIRTEINRQNLIGLVFHTIGVSDGISMGTEGMKYSMPSRDLIADSIETVAGAQWYDGLVAVVGCDKNMPGALMAIGRLNRPSIMVYGGTIAPGCHAGKKLDVVSAFEALGQKVNGTISEEDFGQVVLKACPGPGACGGMYTANTMASAIEAMGMCLPFNASNPAAGNEKVNEGRDIAAAIDHLLENDIKPRDIVTMKSLENAVRLITVLGGSTNAVIHLIAISKAFGLSLDLKQFQEWSESTPFLADLKPSGQYLMQDLHENGGIPAVMKFMLKNDMLHGDCLTVSGKTISENLAHVDDLTKEQKIIHPLHSPIKSTGHIQILYGNIAPGGAVAKITGKEGEYFKGKARVFDSEAAINHAIQMNTIQSGEVVVIRYCGPKGGPGIPEMLKPTSLIMGVGLGNKVALITDGRFSGGTHGFVVGHITPEAYEGGNVALLQDGDIITIDASTKRINAAITEEEWVKRKRNWIPPIDESTGYLKKYRRFVSSASEGCITDEF